MPPRTRMRATKVQKENVGVVKKIRSKVDDNATKTTRKALADKTNSLSDTDSTNPCIKPPSIMKEVVPKTTSKTADKAAQNKSRQTTSVKTRPKRNCRAKSLKESISESSLNNTSLTSSPFKTPIKSVESSLIANRPKRICRLPSKFEDHFVSPSKLVPVQPCHSSTPIQKKNVKTIVTDVVIPKKGSKNQLKERNESLNVVEKGKQKSKYSKTINADSSTEKSSPDTNNNGKMTRPRRGNVNTKLQVKKVSPKSTKFVPFAKRVRNKSLSFKVLEDNKSNENRKNLDIYEFTYDPNEEPTPRKKKKKTNVKKKPTKLKTAVIKSNYNDSVAKALNQLRAKIKPSQPQSDQNKPTQSIPNTQVITKHPENVQSQAPIKAYETTNNISQNNSIINVTPVVPQNDSAKTSIHESNYASIRIEDIAADFEPIKNHSDINYSPVNSPYRPKTPEASKLSVSTQNKDPLNLQADSFFDDQPVASSSMNVSVRHPQASPWRVEFGSLPIKWQANTYVKPNMTPAVESSFINSEDFGKKKHVYTNLLAEETLPYIEDNPSGLKQTSIISFMKEVAERSLKKKRKRSVSPTKQSFMFDDIPSFNSGHKTPKKAKKSINDAPNNSNDKSEEIIIEKSKKKNDKDFTFFGFDDSEDQENVSPVKIVPNTRSKRGVQPRAVLQEFNVQRGPTRAVMPVKAKVTSSEAVEQLYDQLKSAEEASQFPEKETEGQIEKSMTNVDAPTCSYDDNDSVHLFEDIELIHHLKPHRKSKTKKVAFQRLSDSDIDSQDGPDPMQDCSDEDDLADLSFHLPNVKEKKVTKKKKSKKNLLSKKEEKEVEEWAAGFNSMCEDIDEFPLVVE